MRNYEDLMAQNIYTQYVMSDRSLRAVQIIDFFRRYRLSLLYQNVLDDFDIRSILIENLETGESRSVCHLNYTTWPDHGVPQSAVPLLQVCEVKICK